MAHTFGADPGRHPGNGQGGNRHAAVEYKPCGSGFSYPAIGAAAVDRKPFPFPAPCLPAKRKAKHMKIKNTPSNLFGQFDPKQMQAEIDNEVRWVCPGVTPCGALDFPKAKSSKLEQARTPWLNISAFLMVCPMSNLTMS